MSVSALSHLVTTLVDRHGWRHMLGENQMSSDEMGAPNTLLPVLVFLASKNHEQMFNEPLGVSFAQSPDSLLGVEVVATDELCPAATLALVQDALYELNSHVEPDLAVRPATFLDTAVQQFIDAMGSGPYQHISLPGRVRSYEFNRVAV